MLKKQGKFDIVVGGQYGDEGKGSVASWLGDHRKYGFTARVGGDNAEHRFDFRGKEYTGRAIPCAWINPKMHLFMGAGHMFGIEQLMKEARQMQDVYGKDTINRILIDRNAGVVAAEHSQASQNFDRSKRGGTTGKGTGRATAHKVSRDGNFKTADKYPELAENFEIGNVSLAANDLMQIGEDGLLEGSQGALLSVNHGYYPFCTAKDVTPAALIAEAGFDIFKLRDIYAVYRTFPMRVPGASGPTGGEEIPWAEMEEHLGYKLDEKLKRQTLADGTKGDYERMFRWDWKDFEQSLVLCSPTCMVLTFADWYVPGDAGKTKFKDLHASTKELVAGMEERAKKLLGRTVKVGMIKTGPGENQVILR